MIRNFMASTAVIALLTAPALAQDATKTPEPTATTQGADMNQDMASKDMRWLSSQFTGKPVFTASSAAAEGENTAIGEVNDLLISADGQIESLIVGVGGFLGIGEKDVAIDFSEVKVERSEGGEARLVVNSTKEQLEAAQDFDHNTILTGTSTEAESQMTANTEQPADASEQPADSGQMTASTEQPADASEQPADSSQTTASTEQPADAGEQPADSGQMAANTEQPADAGEEPANSTDVTASTEQPADANQTTASTEQPADSNQTAETNQQMANAEQPDATAGTATDAISADKLIGLSVYDAADERVGEVGDVILTKDGDVDAVIVDVGGFLGLGEKPVAIGFDQLQVNGAGSADFRLMSPISKDKFEAAAAYNKDEYETRRGEMRVQAN